MIAEPGMMNRILAALSTLRKSKGKWRIVHEHVSLALDGAALGMALSH
jgi:hypothetical protein